MVTLLKPREAADALGISENGVYRLIASGALRAVDVSQPGARSSKTRLRSDDLEAFIDARTRGSPPSGHGGSGSSRQARGRSRRPRAHI